MRLSTLVWRESWGRKTKLCISLAAIGLAVAGFVCVTVSLGSWERSIETQLQSLGPNAFLVPRKTSMSAFHRADFQEPQMPEYYISKLRRAGIIKPGFGAPALLFTTRLKSQKVVLRGWSEEFQLQGVPQVPRFAANEVVLGAEAAEGLGLHSGEALQIRGKSFQVKAVRPKFGSPLDVEILCHLSQLQQMLRAEDKFTMVELIVTTQSEIDRLSRELPTILPDLRLITRQAIIKTQLDTLSTARRYSFLLVGLIALAAGLGICLQTATNVRRRRREVGTLMAVGASMRQILWLFIHKAVLVGFAGGVGGYLLGTAAAALLGTLITEQPARASFGLLFNSLLIGVVLSSLAAAIPALHAARLDPVEALSEK